MPDLLGVAAPPGAPPQPMWMTFVPIVLMVAIFYFLLIAPQRKKQKKHSEMLSNLKAGDRVVTNGGIYGTVVGVSDRVVHLRVADQVKIEVAKQAIAGFQEQES